MTDDVLGEGWVTEEEARQQFGVSMSTFRSWRRQGRITYYRFGNVKGIRFKQTDLDRFRDSRRVEAS